jgi:magnesium chelatase subunit I
LLDFDPDQPQETDAPATDRPTPRSLKELVNMVTGRSEIPAPMEDSGVADNLPFPFLALVGQAEMKLALILSVINPAIGGVLLMGPRGTGKTTAVRSLLHLLPQVERSACFYGCLPEDVENGGMDAVCPDCARKFAMGDPLTITSPVNLVELPLNARMEDVIGGLDDRAALHDRLRLKRGILAQADLNLLYVDEVNLLADEIINAILDASATGVFTVHRGPISATYRSRLTLIGSMNPEEGNLRPQILDRFGLRVMVRGLTEPAERLEAYQRVTAFRSNPHQFLSTYDSAMQLACEEIEQARALLPNISLPQPIAQAGIQLIQRLEIESLRAEITLFESSRALAAADGRNQVQLADLMQMAPLALRLRRSDFMQEYFKAQVKDDGQITNALDEMFPAARK